MWRQLVQQQAPFGERLVDQPELSLLQVAEPTVGQPGRARRRSARPVVLLDDADGQAAARSIECCTGPHDSASDDEDVDAAVLQLVQCAGTLDGIEPAGGQAETVISTRWKFFRSE
jgi:hypothetical protein